MILAVVGTQLPFDRLVRALDDWAGRSGHPRVFAQIGPTQYRPRNIEWAKFLDPTDYKVRFERANLLVAHAGMGSIIGALEARKPIVIMPRRASLGEHRNEHQLATVTRFRGRPGLRVAADERELPRLLDDRESIVPGPPIGASASAELIDRIRAFIHYDGSVQQA